MFNVSSNGIIRVNRGDTFDIPLFINQGTELEPVQYILSGDSQVYFALLEPNQPFENALLKKVYTPESLDPDGNVIIRFEHNDTVDLEPGKYFYQIKLRSNDGQQYIVNTVVPKTEFYIYE